MASRPNLTDSQKRLQKHLDIAADLAIAYAAPEVPALGNATPQGLVEDLGRVNAARKALEKVEGILKERVSAVSDGAKKIDADNFVYTKVDRERTALDQTAAKVYLEEQGVLSQFMVTTQVPTVTVKER